MAMIIRILVSYENTMENKVCVVTGANKGIGYGIVKELCRRGVGIVYLTAIDKILGENAVKDLKNVGLNPIFYELDVTSSDSVKKLAAHLKEKHGGLDILINNAGVTVENFYNTTYEDSKRVMDTNYYSLLIIQEYMFPLLKDNARVVNISSDCGHISNLKNQYWIERLTKADIEVEDVNAFATWFLDSVRDGNLKEEDFAEVPLLAYRISKIALSALTRVQQLKIGRGISINSLYPGFVRTDLTNNSGYMSVEEACKTPVYLVLDADQSLKGKYIWFDRSEKDWADATADLYCRMKKIENCIQKSKYS